MKTRHVPVINPRYWAAILLASVFGTNLGDFYAHESGLGILWGLVVLLALAIATFVVERFDDRSHEAYYWLVIILIRTGATNIADYLAFRVRVPPLVLTTALATGLTVFAWIAARERTGSGNTSTARPLPVTNGAYWLAMLMAGVFGTVVGDICSHWMGEGLASIGLGIVFALALLARQICFVPDVLMYWITVAAARCAGTAIGDWLAENKQIEIGLPLSTLMTGAIFVAILLLWRSQPAPVTGSAAQDHGK